MAVAAVYHPVEQVRPHLGGSTLVLRDTTAWFAADSTAYRDTPLRPPAPPPEYHRDPLSPVAAACRAAGLDLHAWIVCCHAVTLGRQHPGLCQQNALGERLFATLCPSQPAVRNYLAGAVRDVAVRDGVKGVILESLHFHPRRPETPYEKTAVPFGPVESYFRGLCICPVCRRRAAECGADAERVAALARDRLQQFVSGGAPDSRALAEVLAADPDLRRYHQARQAAVMELIRACHAAAQPRESCLFLLGDEYQAGASLAQVAGEVTRAAQLFHSPAAGDDVALLEQLFATGQIQAGRFLASLIGHPLRAPDATALSRRMTALSRAGARHFIVYNYGLLTYPQIEWVREAFHAACAEGRV